MFDYIALGEQAVAIDSQILAGDKAALAAFPDSPKRRLNPVQGPFEWDPVPDQLNAFFDFLREHFGIDLGHAGRQALDPFPVNERCVSGFRWQSPPYEICGGSDPAFEYPGEDYLVAYWMGRHYGFLGEAD